MYKKTQAGDGAVPDVWSVTLSSNETQKIKGRITFSEKNLNFKKESGFAGSTAPARRN